MKTVNKDFIQVWADTLRSSKYEQCQDKLKKGESYCCLGVACDLVGGEWSPEGHFMQGHKRVGKTSVPYDISSEHWGLGFVQLQTLSEMNDTGKTFEEIADYLEETYLA